jgi:hypothetical protein
MSIKVDWQIIEDDEIWVQQSPPEDKPKRRVPRRLIFALALIPIVAAVAFAAYVAWTYHQQLGQVTVPVQQVARAELQSVAANDQIAFMALQDPDDQAWRTLQERTFGRLERVGLPEYGWPATGVPPQIGHVSLEPGGALVQVTYQFSVTQPVPREPATITLQIPAFYRATASGWVHAMPTADLWGPERTQNGQHVLALYHQLDAGIVEPLLPRLDDVFARLCASLSCPSQVSVVFDTSVSLRRGFLGGNDLNSNRSRQDSLGGNGPGNFNGSRQDFFGGNGLGNMPRLDRGSLGENGPVTLRFSSPYAMALPTDANSRDVVYRVFESQLARTLVSQALGRNLYTNRLASLAIAQWELARVGLVSSFLTPSNRDALVAKLESGVSQPLATITLRSTSPRIDTSDQAIMSFAFAFLEQTLGSGTVERLIPAIGTSATLGEAIQTTLQVDPGTLEGAWQSYLKDAAGPLAQSQGGA